MNSLSNLPFAERVERAHALFADEDEDERIRCRAAGILSAAHLHHGELDAAIETCTRRATLTCLTPPACERYTRLRDAQTALGGGDAERALGLLEGTGASVVRSAVEVSALRALGRDSSELAARCWDIYGDSDDPRVRELARPCAPMGAP